MHLYKLIGPLSIVDAPEIRCIDPGDEDMLPDLSATVVRLHAFC